MSRVYLLDNYVYIFIHTVFICIDLRIEENNIYSKGVLKQTRKCFNIIISPKICTLKRERQFPYVIVPQIHTF